MSGIDALLRQVAALADDAPPPDLAALHRAGDRRRLRRRLAAGTSIAAGAVAVLVAVAVMTAGGHARTSLPAVPDLRNGTLVVPGAGESCWPWLLTEVAACSWTVQPTKLPSGQPGRPTAPSWRSCEAAATSAKAAVRCGSSSPKPTAPTFAGSRGVPGPASGVTAWRSSGLPPATGWRSPAGGTSTSSASGPAPCDSSMLRVLLAHPRGRPTVCGSPSRRGTQWSWWRQTEPTAHGRNRPGAGRTHRLVAGRSQTAVSGDAADVWEFRGLEAAGEVEHGRVVEVVAQAPGEGPAAASWSPSGEDRLVYFRLRARVAASLRSCTPWRLTGRRTRASTRPGAACPPGVHRPGLPTAPGRGMHWLELDPPTLHGLVLVATGGPGRVVDAPVGMSGPAWQPLPK